MQTECTAAEEWRPIPDWPYEVSNFGRVRRTAPWRCGGVGTVLRPGQAWYGYQKVVLCNQGKQWHVLVHRLVLTVFVGPPDATQVANHIDANPANNRLDNLEWVTQAGNVQHAFTTGRASGRRGRASPVAVRLTDEQVREICAQRDRVSGAALAKRYGVSPMVISHILRGLHWSTRTDR